MGCIAPGGGHPPREYLPSLESTRLCASLLEWVGLSPGISEVFVLNPTSCFESFPEQAWFCILKTLNKYRYLNFFVHSENHSMNWQRLYRSTGLTHFTDEATDRRRWRELLKVARGSAMTRARSRGSFHASVLAHQRLIL